MTLCIPQVRDDGRLAGRVLRYHTWPTHQRQSVAEHSWQVMRIIGVIWPEAPVHIFQYIIRHDSPEILTGDAPYPVKANNPTLAAEMNRLEDEGLEELVKGGFMFNSLPLTPDERWAFKLAEFIEMWEFGLEEEMLGNKFARLVTQRCWKAIWDRIRNDVFQTLDKDKKAIAKRAKEYVTRRDLTWEP